MSKEFYARLAAIQENLNAPKNQYNSFGKYKYRSCEDILEGVKPLLNGLFLSISDEVVLIGDRYYVKATATITDGENSHTATALAREEESKKGMDSAQVNLQLAVKGEYFDAMIRGEKTEEYRLCNDYWNKRIMFREYDRLIITKGYPKRDDSSRRIDVPYGGYEVKTITHPHFGDKPVKVYAIKVNINC